MHLKERGAWDQTIGAIKPAYVALFLTRNN